MRFWAAFSLGIRWEFSTMHKTHWIACIISTPKNNLWIKESWGPAPWSEQRLARYPLVRFSPSWAGALAWFSLMWWGLCSAWHLSSKTSGLESLAEYSPDSSSEQILHWYLSTSVSPFLFAAPRNSTTQALCSPRPFSALHFRLPPIQDHIPPRDSLLFSECGWGALCYSALTFLCLKKKKNTHLVNMGMCGNRRNQPCLHFRADWELQPGQHQYRYAGFVCNRPVVSRKRGKGGQWLLLAVCAAVPDFHLHHSDHHPRDRVQVWYTQLPRVLEPVVGGLGAARSNIQAGVCAGAVRIDTEPDSETIVAKRFLRADVFREVSQKTMGWHFIAVLTAVFGDEWGYSLLNDHILLDFARHAWWKGEAVQALHDLRGHRVSHISLHFWIGS